MANTKESTPDTGTELATTDIMPSPAQLREVQTIQDAAALLQTEFGATIVDASDLGDGFALLGQGVDSKMPLVGKPTFFLSWNFTLGDKGEFVSARVVVEESQGVFKKYIINDGGTGICEQLREFTMRTGQARGLMAVRGLRRSEYNHPIHGSGVTYYIDTSASK